jgi:hypothetical protein
MAVKVCRECKYYKDPSLADNIFRPGWMFGPKCSHENARDEVSGEKTPCVTMRVNKCSAGQLFELKRLKGGRND